MGLAFEEVTYSAKGAPDSPNVSENCKYGEKDAHGLKIHCGFIARWYQGEEEERA
jgi:hypothetical protein